MPCWVGAGAPPLAPPSQNIRQWRGNFLANGLEPWAFMYPGWDSDRRARFREHYRAHGWTHLPFAVWASYKASGITYDYHAQPAAFRAILDELLADGMVPCVYCHTDAVPGWGPLSRAHLETWAKNFLPRIASPDVLWCTGFEAGQIDQEWSGAWTGKGKELIGWARTLRGTLGPDAVIYVHWPPERITGYPNYPDHSGPQDEPSWWHEVGGAVDGLLYQRWPTEDERWVLAHTIGGEAPNEHGNMEYDKGDALRIAGGAWEIQKDFVFFEHSRDPQRWARLVAGVATHPLISGWC